MSNVSEMKKSNYFSPEVEVLFFFDKDIITASNQGTSDGSYDGSDVDHSAWT
jgi:hypothetical protein